MSKKTISINPELFNISSFDSNTRKKRPSKSEHKPKIKVRTKEKPKNNKTLKRNLINMIRKHQQQKIDKLNKDPKHRFPTLEPVSKEDFSKKDDIVNFNNDFNDSVNFLKELTKRTEDKKKMEQFHNKTLRKYTPLAHETISIHNPTSTSSIPTIQSVPSKQPEPAIHLNVPPSLASPLEDFSDSISKDTLGRSNNTPEIAVHYNHYKPPPPPPYGCLKNGSLPLYKTWKNNTQKKYPIDDDDADNRYVQKKPTHIDSVRLAHINHMRSNIKPFLNRKIKKPNKKIRKTIRRTFRVGRSKVKPNISVLISNRTIRNNITTKKQLLKQIPIEEIRKYLISHGFINIGSSAPNDVLRKMYETASMMCGEIQNHNPQHIIFNYMNDTSDPYSNV